MQPEIIAAAVAAQAAAAPLSVTDIVLIIGVITTSIVTILNAWKGNIDRKVVQATIAQRSDSQDQKLDEIHEATNGGVQILRDKLAAAVAVADAANARINALEALVTRLADAQGGPK